VSHAPTTPSTTPETLYLIGTSGHPNYGDECTTAAWLRYLARARPDDDVWLDCPDPGLASHLFHGLHPRLHTTDVVWRVVWETTDMEPADAAAHVDRVLTDLGTPRIDLGLLGARRADTVHLLGGGYVNAKWPTHMMLMRAALRLRDLGGARVVATGQGLVPPVDPGGLREYFDSFDHASVRDAPSAELTGAGLVCDDVLLALGSLPGYREGTYAAEVAQGDVWVCLQNDMSSQETFEAALSAVRTALESPELAGRPVRYLEALPGVDRIAYDRLSDLIPEEHFLPFVQLWENGFPARAGQTWFTSRFHLHLLAAASGAEGTALVVSEDYYQPQHQSLVDAGTGWSVTPAGSKSIERPGSARSFRAEARNLHEAKLEEARMLYPATPQDPSTPPSLERPDPPKRGAAGWLRRT